MNCTNASIISDMPRKKFGLGDVQNVQYNHNAATQCNKGNTKRKWS